MKEYNMNFDNKDFVAFNTNTASLNNLLFTANLQQDKLSDLRIFIENNHKLSIDSQTL